MNFGMNKIGYVFLLVIILFTFTSCHRNEKILIVDKDIINSFEYEGINVDTLIVKNSVKKIMHDAFKDANIKNITFENDAWYACDKYKCMHPTLITIDNDVFNTYNDYDLFIKDLMD